VRSFTRLERAAYQELERLHAAIDRAIDRLNDIVGLDDDDDAVRDHLTALLLSAGSNLDADMQEALYGDES